MMQTTINYLFALAFGVAAGYSLARMQERMRHRRIWQRMKTDLDWEQLKKGIWGNDHV